MTKIPFKREYDLYRSRLTKAEIDAIEAWINDRIEGREIRTAGWMPGRDWRGTVLQPIYEKATLRNHDLAGKCFGLMVYVVFMNRPETWISGRFELDGRDIGSRTYFQPR